MKATGNISEKTQVIVECDEHSEIWNIINVGIKNPRNQNVG